MWIISLECVKCVKCFFFYDVFSKWTSCSIGLISGFISGGLCHSVLQCWSVCLMSEWPVLSPVGVVVTGLSEVLWVWVYGVGVSESGCRLLPLRSHTESPDRSTAAGTHRQTHLCRGWVRNFLLALCTSCATRSLNYCSLCFFGYLYINVNIYIFIYTYGHE